MDSLPSPLFFVTGNSEKFREVQSILPGIEQLELDLPEIQELDPKKIIGEKLHSAAANGHRNILVEDTSLSFHVLHGLPGPLIKWFLSSLGNDGLWELVRERSDHSATATAMFGFLGETGAPHFTSASVNGTIVAPRGRGFGWDPIFQPAGSDKSFGEMSAEEKSLFSMRSRALYSFLDIFA